MGAGKTKKTAEPRILNRRARHEYEILETYQAGMVLKGPEVKSVREGNASLAESFAKIDGGEVFLYNMYVAPYEKSWEKPDPRRPRKLLLQRTEIAKLVRFHTQRGLALIPLKLYFQRGWAKVELGVGRGKKQYDKREALKRRESQREIERAR